MAELYTQNYIYTFKRDFKLFNFNWLIGCWAA